MFCAILSACKFSKDLLRISVIFWCLKTNFVVLWLAGHTFMTDGSCGYFGIVTGRSRVHARWAYDHDMCVMRILISLLVGNAFMTGVMRSWHVCHADITIVTGECVHDWWVMWLYWYRDCWVTRSCPVGIRSWHVCHADTNIVTGG